MEIETEFWVDEKLTDSTSVVLRTDAFADNEKMEPFMKSSLLSFMKSSLESAGQEYNEAECLALIEEQMESTKMTTTFDEYTTTEVHLATGWPIVGTAPGRQSYPQLRERRKPSSRSLPESSLIEFRL